MIKLYGTTWCPDCVWVKEYLGKRAIDYEFRNIEVDAQARNFVEQIKDPKKYPVLQLDDGNLILDPSPEDLDQKLTDLTQQTEHYYDLIIVGGGPTGLTAAIYSAREGQNVLVLEKSVLGGQAATTWTIENYPGFPEPINGLDFAARLEQQSRSAGADIAAPVEVQKINKMGTYIFVKTDQGVYHSKAVLLATGATYRRLNLLDEDKFIGKGIHYCATCDGAFYRGKSIAVVGGGNSAAEESLFLTRFADQITILVRDSQLKAEDITIKKVLKHPKINILYNLEVKNILNKDGKFTGVTAYDSDKQQDVDLPFDGMFVLIGQKPATDFLGPDIDLDQYGYIKTDPMLQTNMVGVFAAGDSRANSTKQIASAVGEGATAALMIRQFLNKS